MVNSDWRLEFRDHLEPFDFRMRCFLADSRNPQNVIYLGANQAKCEARRARRRLST